MFLLVWISKYKLNLTKRKDKKLKPSDTKLPSNKTFGYFFSFVFIIVALYFYYLKNQNIGYILTIISVLLIIITFIRASLLQPLNKLWIRFGILLVNIIIPIILGIIFFGIFTPYSIIMKIMGRDELRLKRIDNNSHWIIRRKSSQQTDFKKQF